MKYLVCLFSLSILAQNPVTPTWPVAASFPVASRNISDVTTTALGTASTTVNVQNGSQWRIGTIARIDYEAMLISNKSSNTLYLTRGYAGTTAANHNAYSTITSDYEDYYLNLISAELGAIEAWLPSHTGGGGSMVYPSSGIPQSTGSAWGTSLTLTTSVGTPGSDTYIPSEKAIRTAISAATGAPGGSTGQFEYNNAGSFGGIGGTANTVMGYAVTSTPTALALPSCSSASNALTWTTGTGFGCNTISGGGGGASASSDLSDFKITKTSSLILSGNAGVGRSGTAFFNPSTYSFTLTTYAITGISSASQAVLTLASSPPAGMFSFNDTIYVTGVTGSGCSGLNGLQTITNWDGASHVTVNFNSAALTCTGGTFGSNPSASGTAYIYLDYAGVVNLVLPASAGLLATGTGTFATLQESAPSFPQGSIPIATVSLSASGWNALTDQRAFLSNITLQAGTGMSITEAGGVNTVAIDPAIVPRLGQTNAWTGVNDFSAATSVIPARSGTSLPGTCSVGQAFIKTNATASSQWYLCTSTNTWTVQGGGGGGSVTCDPSDPTTECEKDEFLLMTPGTGFRGDLHWQAFSNDGSVGATELTPEANHDGILQLSIDANHSGALVLSYGSTAHLYAPATQAGWELKYIIRLPAVTSVAAFVGLGSASAAGYDTIGFRFDTSTDTTFKCIASSGYSATTTDTLIAPVASTWYTLRLWSTVAGTVNCSVNDGTTYSVASGMPSSNLLPAVWITAGGTARTIDADWFFEKRTVTR